jgi:1-acyl-sn-glycerol-3-phosphate acyltransferase
LPPAASPARAEAEPIALRKRNRLWRRARRVLGRAYLRLLGWRIEGEVPAARKFVVIAAPHTSYWDFPHMIAFGFASGQYISFLMKSSLFVGPLGTLFRGLGGVPVDRSASSGVVESVVREFARADELIVVIAPEGTRGRRDHWKSGFYHVAQRAGVPIALGFLDYSRKVVGYGPALTPDVDWDEDVVAEFYAEKRGRYPAQESVVRMRAPSD